MRSAAPGAAGLREQTRDQASSTEEDSKVVNLTGVDEDCITLSNLPDRS